MKSEKLEKLVDLAGNYWSHTLVAASGLAGGAVGVGFGENIVGRNASAYALVCMAGVVLGAYASMGALYCLSELHSVIERKIERKAAAYAKNIEDIAA